MSDHGAIAGNSSWYSRPYFVMNGWQPSDFPFLQLTLSFISLVYAWETYLDYRQHKLLKVKEFPEQLKTAIERLDVTVKDRSESRQRDENSCSLSSNSLLASTVEKYDKSRAYGLDKSTFGFIKGVYSYLETIALLLLGYLPALWTISGYLLSSFAVDPEHEIARSMVMLLLSMLRDTIVSFPFGLYSTFVIEQRHGFNKQTIGLYLADMLKQLALSIIIGFPVAAVLIRVIKWGGEYFYVYVWAFLLVFSIIMMTIFPIWIMPLFNKFTPLEEGELRSEIEALASRLNFPLTKLFVCDGSKRSSHSNAYFYGFYKNKRIVLYDTLLEHATKEEIVGILGHELGHWKLWHTGQGFIIQQLYIFTCLYVFGLCMNNDNLYRSFGFTPGSKPVIIGFLLFSQTFWAPVEHVLSFLLTLNTRRNEFQADAFAVDLGYAKQLQTGLTKLSLENLSNMNPDKWYSAYHYDHPPLVERLSAISEREKKKL